MRVLLTGGYGFIGAGIAAALRGAGHDVVAAVRKPTDHDLSSGRAIPCDMGRDLHCDDWFPRLKNLDAVVNCAGILRERGNDTFQSLHVDAPIALFHACAESGIRRVVQISAIGNPAETEFIDSKHRCDTALAALDLDWVVLRPSVVYSAAGSYGGTSLLRAQAALPWVIFVPGRGDQRIQPICLEDLCSAVLASVVRPGIAREVIDLAGPQVLTISEYLLVWRRWLGFDEARVVHVPGVLVMAACGIGETAGAGPFGNTMRRMLECDNVAAPDSLAKMDCLLGLRPRSLECALVARPVQTQDRLHASLYFVFPLLQWGLAIVWLASAIIGFSTPAATIRELFVQAHLPAMIGPPLVYTVSGLDAIVGVMALSRRWLRVAAFLMLGSALGYTVLVGGIWSAVWFDPYGGLIKNIGLIPAILILLAWTRHR
jgi:uncharacterized protein YbjT (DUF2867 family)